MATKPFSQYFGTNFTPSDVELAQIRDIIQEPTTRIASIQHEINEFRKTEASLEASVRDYRILMSPFRRLPDDVLRSIFIACLIVREDRLPTMSNKEAPILLTHVSRRWREISHTTPRLWASLHVPIPPIMTMDNHEDPPRFSAQKECSVKITALRVEAVDAWLKRSGACKLSISLYDGEGPFGNGLSTSHFFKVLLSHKDRLRRLSITTFQSVLANLKGVLQVKLPILQTLNITLFPESRFRQPEEITHQYDALFNAPNVRQLGLVGVPGDFSVHQRITNTNWSSLVTLFLKDGHLGYQVGHPSTLEIQDALRPCILLRKLILKFTTNIRLFPGGSQALGMNDVPRTGTAHVSLPALRDLVLHDSSSQSPLLPNLIAPSLLSLEYSSSVSSADPDDVEPSPLLSFLRISCCSLKKLSTSISFTRDDFISCLVLCPELQSLTIDPPSQVMRSTLSEDTLSDGFLDLFASPTSNSGPSFSKADIRNSSDERFCVLCPKLEEVDLVMPQYGLTEAAVRNFISCKQAGIHPDIAKLKSVNLRSYSQEEIDFFAVFRQEIEDGLKLEIDYQMPSVISLYSLSVGQPTM